MRIDLHSHSTASDGTDPPAEVMRRARGAGLDVIALTDHDTLAGHDEARRALPPGLALVPGMELSCRLDGHSVHLLAYHVDPAQAELAEQLHAITTDRLRRGRDMVAKLRELGVDITWEQVAAIAGDAVVGRPHIARAMVAAGAIASAGAGVHPGLDRAGRPGLREQVRPRPGAGDPPGLRGRGGERARPPGVAPAGVGDR